MSNSVSRTNFVRSDTDLDTPVKGPSDGIPRISAGHEKHEWTSYTARESLFKKVDECLEKEMAKEENNTKNAESASKKSKTDEL